MHIYLFMITRYPKAVRYEMCIVAQRQNDLQHFLDNTFG